MANKPVRFDWLALMIAVVVASLIGHAYGVAMR